MKGYTRLLNKQSVVLACFALAIGTSLWFFDLLTRAQISSNRQAQLTRTLNEVLTDEQLDGGLLKSKSSLFDTNLNVDRTIYTATLNKQPVAVIISASAPDGYAGNIDLLVGLQKDGTITGVRVLQHQETPGLGDDIELRKSDWVLGFNGKSLQITKNWAVKRDGGSFDQFTGATITPRAVVNAVHDTLIFFNNHKSDLFAAAHD